MSFLQAIGSGFRNYASFSGRAVRSEYWYFALFVVIAIVVAQILDVSLFPLQLVIRGVGPLDTLTTLALLLPSAAVAVRRARRAGGEGVARGGAGARRVRDGAAGGAARQRRSRGAAVCERARVGAAGSRQLRLPGLFAERARAVQAPPGGARARDAERGAGGAGRGGAGARGAGAARTPIVTALRADATAPPTWRNM